METLLESASSGQMQVTGPLEATGHWEGLEIFQQTQ